MDIALSLLLPALLFSHAIWAVHRAGLRKRALLTIMPAVCFALATLWLANSILAVWNGGPTPAFAHATRTLGPVMLCLMATTAEVPFLVLRAHLWWQGWLARRPAKPKASARGRASR